MTFAYGVKIEVENGCSTRFWFDQRVGNNNLASIFLTIFMLAMDPSTTVNIKLACLMEK